MIVTGRGRILVFRPRNPESVPSVDHGDGKQGLATASGACYNVVRIRDGKVGDISGTYAFGAPQGVTVGDDGSVYVADTGNGAVCRIKDGKVTPLVPSGSGLTSPVGLLARSGRLYICDTFARKVFVYRF